MAKGNKPPKKKQELIFRPMDPVEYIEQDGFMFQWCCDCHLRHISHFHIVRGESPEKDYVVISCARDEVGTRLRKYYIRREKSNGIQNRENHKDSMV